MSGNAAPSGGGIFSDGRGGSAMLTINNSTLSGNSSSNVAGAIWNDGNGGSATLTIKNSTLSGNSASFKGGGIYNDGSSGGSAPVTIGDTILKVGTSGQNIFNDSGTVTSLGYNLSSDAGVTNVGTGTGSLNATGDQTNTDPKLGPLQDNGGPTFTHALLCDSPAIDKGKNLSGCPTSQNFAGTINNTDPTKNSTLGPSPGSCGTNACPGIAGGAFHYDAYTLVNPSGNAQCFTVTLDGSGCGGTTLWSNAYLGSVDPANACTNFLGSGNTVVPANPYSFSVPGEGTFVITVEEFNPGSGCGNYSMSVSGFSCMSLTDQRGTGFVRTFDDPAKAPATGGDNTDIGAFEAQAPVASCNQPPVAKCKNVTVSAGANCSANASIDNGSYDPDAGDTITLSQSPAGPYSLGTTPVTLTVKDNHGAMSMCSSNVTVKDTMAPVITSISASPNVLKPANHKLRPVTVKVTASDSCDPHPVSKIISVTNNENDTNPNEVQITGNLTVKLEAEVDANAKNATRIYTITVQCKDASGNASTKTTTVTVQKK